MTNTFKSESFLDKKLTSYSQSDYYPFHMPGHKRQPLAFPNPYTMDITEIDGFDNLHHAEGILRDAQRRAARLYHAKETFYLINGSTCGILSAVSAALPRSGRLLMGRNCHKSAYHAAFLRQLKTCYILPVMTDFGISGSVRPQDISMAFEENPDIGAVFLTSPTYDGVVSDIRSIAEVVHAHNVPLIVDEAHGAHFTFSGEFPDSALNCGADIVIQSLHKTLPCFTQTALLHINSDRISSDSVKQFLGIYETSSPSYLLMASMEQGLRLMTEHGPDLMEDFTGLLKNFYQQARTLRYLSVFRPESCRPDTCFAHDFSKILISTANAGLTGQELSDILLEKYHLQMEMASGHYVTALTSVMDTAEGFERLLHALKETDRSCGKSKAAHSLLTSRELYTIPTQRLTLTEAIELPGTAVPLGESSGCISQEFVSLYPPGIPLIAPGEIITPELIQNIALCRAQGLSVEGMAKAEYISVVV